MHLLKTGWAGNMKFTIGDNIVLKRTGEEGRVTAFIDKQMIEVEVGGTVFPVYLEDIDHPYLNWFTQKTVVKKKQVVPAQLPVEKPAARVARLANGVYLSFMPVFKTVDMEEVVSVVKVYLLNELPVSVKYAYDVRIKEQSLFSHEGAIHAFGNVYLHSLEYADMNDQPRMNWVLTDVQNEQNEKEEGVLRIKPAKLFGHVSDILQGKTSSFEYKLIEDFILKQKKEEPVYEPIVRKSVVAPVTTRTIEDPVYELDLHIEQLVSNMKGLTNAEIIKIQLDTLQRYVHVAIVHRQERMVVIHGLGKGRLRDEVHAVLKKIPEVARYKNEWSGKYGFGATEILFRY